MKVLMKVLMKAYEGAYEGRVDDGFTMGSRFTTGSGCFSRLLLVHVLV